jgi:carbohydrate-binding DOMON domain-containing protein
MSNKIWRHTSLSLALLALLAVPALGQSVSFSDPTGDDNGPGEYVYPTDAVYTRGSFDLTGLEVTAKGDRVTFDVSVAAKLEDPWRMGTGFAVQMVFIFIDTGNDDPHFTSGLPGLNIQFAEPGWDRVVILSPQGFSRVNQEVQAKVAADKQSAVVVPTRVRGRGQTINGSVKLDQLGGGDPSTWGYQVVMQSNEGFPAEGDLLTRKVNEFEGQHRFGGGSDYDCDPHVMDVLGDQAAQLAYECGPSGESKKMATLTMVYK